MDHENSDSCASLYVAHPVQSHHEDALHGATGCHELHIRAAPGSPDHSSAFGPQASNSEPCALSHLGCTDGEAAMPPSSVPAGAPPGFPVPLVPAAHGDAASSSALAHSVPLEPVAHGPWMASVPGPPTPQVRPQPFGCREIAGSNELAGSRGNACSSGLAGLREHDDSNGSVALRGAPLQCRTSRIIDTGRIVRCGYCHAKSLPLASLCSVCGRDLQTNPSEAELLGDGCHQEPLSRSLALCRAVPTTTSRLEEALPDATPMHDGGSQCTHARVLDQGNPMPPSMHSSAIISYNPAEAAGQLRASQSSQVNQQPAFAAPQTAPSQPAGEQPPSAVPPSVPHLLVVGSGTAAPQAAPSQLAGEQPPLSVPPSVPHVPVVGSGTAAPQAAPSQHVGEHLSLPVPPSVPHVPVVGSGMPVPPSVPHVPVVGSGIQTQFFELSPVSVATEFGLSAASPAPIVGASGIAAPVVGAAIGIGALVEAAAVPFAGAASPVPAEGAGGMRAPVEGAAASGPSGTGDMHASRCRRCQTVPGPMARFCDICGFALSEAAGYRSDATVTGPTGSSHGQEVGRSFVQTGIRASQASAPVCSPPTTSHHNFVCGAPGRHETFVHDSARDLWPNSAEVVPLGDGDHKEPLSSRAPALIGCLCRAIPTTQVSQDNHPSPANEASDMWQSQLLQLAGSKHGPEAGSFNGPAGSCEDASSNSGLVDSPDNAGSSNEPVGSHGESTSCDAPFQCCGCETVPQLMRRCNAFFASNGGYPEVQSGTAAAAAASAAAVVAATARSALYRPHAATPGDGGGGNRLSFYDSPPSAAEGSTVTLSHCSLSPSESFHGGDSDNGSEGEPSVESKASAQLVQQNVACESLTHGPPASPFTDVSAVQHTGFNRSCAAYFYIGDDDDEEFRQSCDECFLSPVQDMAVDSQYTSSLLSALRKYGGGSICRPHMCQEVLLSKALLDSHCVSEISLPDGFDAPDLHFVNPFWEALLEAVRPSDHDSPPMHVSEVHTPVSIPQSNSNLHPEASSPLVDCQTDVHYKMICGRQCTACSGTPLGMLSCTACSGTVLGDSVAVIDRHLAKIAEISPDGTLSCLSYLCSGSPGDMSDNLPSDVSSRIAFFTE
jgi:hypothetical protein